MVRLVRRTLALAVTGLVAGSALAIRPNDASAAAAVPAWTGLTGTVVRTATLPLIPLGEFPTACCPAPYVRLGPPFPTP
jgi:hypothetical protein